jgi:hypothetical protein
VPVFHKEAWTTDRIYNWVTPKTGQNHQFELNEARALGHPVQVDGEFLILNDYYFYLYTTTLTIDFYICYFWLDDYYFLTDDTNKDRAKQRLRASVIFAALRLALRSASTHCRGFQIQSVKLWSRFKSCQSDSLELLATKSTTKR